MYVICILYVCIFTFMKRLCNMVKRIYALQMVPMGKKGYRQLNAVSIYMFPSAIA